MSLTADLSDANYADILSATCTATSYPTKTIRYGNRRQFSDFALANAKTEMFRDVLGYMVAEIRADIACAEMREHVVRYPDGWWEAFKDRWFPEWAKLRWGVRMKREVFRFDVLFPELASNRDHGAIVVHKVVSRGTV